MKRPNDPSNPVLFGALFILGWFLFLIYGILCAFYPHLVRAWYLKTEDTEENKRYRDGRAKVEFLKSEQFIRHCQLMGWIMIGACIVVAITVALTLGWEPPIG